MTRPDGRIRVLLVVDSMRLGGAQKAICNLITAADHSRFAFRVCALGRGNEMAQDFSLYGVELVILGAPRWDPLVYFKLKRVVRDFEPDVLYAHLVKSTLMCSRVAAATGVPFVCHDRLDLSYNWLEPLLRGRTGTRLARMVVRRALRRATAVLAVAHSVADELLRLRMTVPEKLTVVTNGLDLKKYDLNAAQRATVRDRVRTEFGFPADAIVLINASRFDPVKNWPAFLRAVERARAASDHVQALAVGDGPLLGKMRSLAAELGLGGSVVFPGFRRDALELMSAADVLLFPSLAEGDSNTVKEAMACGLAVVAFAAGDTARAVRDGQDGFVVPVGDEAALQDRLCRVVADAALRRGLAESARARAFTEFGIERTARVIENVLLRAAQTRTIMVPAVTKEQRGRA